MAVRPIGAQEGVRLQGDIILRVARGSADALTVIGELEMSGRAESFVVATLRGANSPVIIAGASHCGGSCSGIELYVLRVSPFGLERLLEFEEVQRGRAVVGRSGVLTLLEGLYGLGQRPSYQASEYEFRSGRLEKTGEGRASKLPHGGEDAISVEDRGPGAKY